MTAPLAAIVGTEHLRSSGGSLAAAPGTPPALLGDLRVPGAKRTVVFYAHYDGQPVGQKGWLSDPFKPVVRTGPLGEAPVLGR